MALFMPIKPEPASRIYSGRKWFELRKMRPPQHGLVYLYETSDPSEAVHAIRGGFYFDEYLDLPLEELWLKVGEAATSRERFVRYYGTRFKRGIALVIKRIEVLCRPIRISDLRTVDSSFSLPSGMWTYYPIEDEHRIIRYLDSVPRTRRLDRPDPLPSFQSANAALSVRPVGSGEEEHDFVTLYDTFVKPKYQETDAYADTVVGVHAQGCDPYGYFSKRKTIWAFEREREVIGYTVATEKRGGSVKFGPTILRPANRHRGLATPLRLLVEEQYPNARKFFNTLGEDNMPALRYVLRAGYVIEAHLRQQYSASNEIVVGKLCRDGIGLASDEPTPRDATSFQVLDGSSMSHSEIRTILAVLESWYDEIDDGFVAGLLAGMQVDLDLGRKSKRLLVLSGISVPAGLMVVTPKRGGALKCSPVVLPAPANAALAGLLDSALGVYHSRTKKIYMHLPLLSRHAISAATNLGFSVEGVLRQPYKSGIDMLVFARQVK